MVDDVDEVDKTLLVLWLKDTGRKSAFNKAVRAIMATRGGEMMLDRPRGIYDYGVEADETQDMTDIWGGSILLNARIELLLMVATAICPG